MKERRLKILFYCLAGILLVSMLFISRDAGISGDEEVHNIQANNVYDYFASWGKDQDAINTPGTHLQYYGQTPDNIAVILIRWFGIDDIYGFRHIVSAFFGWLTIFVVALFARWLKDYKAALFALVLFAISPDFMGHSQNNLKDIPFALAYIAGVYYILKLTYSEFKVQSTWTIIFLVLSIAFSVSIRAGGILLIFYLFFAAFLFYFIKWITTKTVSWKSAINTFGVLFVISAAGYLIGLLLWPYALQNPIVNPWESYKLMAGFPTTIQQIYDGEFIWSDFHSWHYLIKYMLITIPLVVFLGAVFFIVFWKKIVEKTHRFTYGFLAFSFFFPILFVIIRESNLYGGWRHFLFIYPALVLFSAIGFYELWKRAGKPLMKVIFVFVLGFFMWHPLSFMVKAHPYYYLYYNQLVGGLKGAYGKYETDYYYHTMRTGAEWLHDHLEKNGKSGKVIVGCNFLPVRWYFRDMKNVEFKYFKYSQRNLMDWDYAIICNSYITPYLLTNGLFPPEGTLHAIKIDGVPVCAVVKCLSKSPKEAYKAYTDENYQLAIDKFKESLNYYQKDEMIYYSLGKCLFLAGQSAEAKVAIEKSLGLFPFYEPSLMLMAEMKQSEGNKEEAKDFYRQVINANRKYFRAYVALAGILQLEGDNAQAREILKSCLIISPAYEPAIIAMGDTWKDDNYEIAEKYYEHADKLKQKF